MKVECCECRTTIRPGTGEPGEPVSHGYCPACYQRALGDIDRYFEAIEKEVHRRGAEERFLAKQNEKAGGVDTGPDTKPHLSRERMIV